MRPKKLNCNTERRVSRKSRSMHKDIIGIEHGRYKITSPRNGRVFYRLRTSEHGVDNEYFYYDDSRPSIDNESVRVRGYDTSYHYGFHFGDD